MSFWRLFEKRKQVPTKLELKRLREVDCSEYTALNTHPLVRRQMPLASHKFDREDCK
jgi:hypothetical protein